MTNKAQEIIQTWYSSAEEIKTSSVSLLMEYPQIDGPLTILSENFKIDKPTLLGYIILSLPLVLIIALYVCGGKISTLICVAYPLYASIKACPSASPRKFKRWLTYWLIFASLTLLEQLCAVFISYLPFYLLSKTIFLVWCFHQTSSGEQGSVVLYDKALRPLFVEKLSIHEKYENIFRTERPSDDSLDDTTNDYTLNVVAKRVVLSKESSVFCQIQYLSSKAESTDGTEFKKYKSQIVVGCEIDLNFKIRISPIRDLDGFVLVELLQKDTFVEQPIVLLKEQVSLSEIVGSVRPTEWTFRSADDDGATERDDNKTRNKSPLKIKAELSLQMRMSSI